MSPELALHKALLEHLRADAALAALVGSRIWDAPPEAPDWPYVLFGRTESRPWGGLEGEGVEHVVSLTCHSRFEGGEEARAIVAAMRERLHGAAPALEGWRLVNLRATYADVFRAASGRVVQGVVRVRAVTEPN